MRRPIELGAGKPWLAARTKLVYKSAADCAVAVNDSGTIVICYTHLPSGVLVCRSGALDTASSSITWGRVSPPVMTTSGGVPAVAITPSGSIIVTGSPAQQPVYNLGTLDATGSGLIEWVAVNASQLIMVWQNQAKYYLSRAAQPWPPAQSQAPARA